MEIKKKIDFLKKNKLSILYKLLKVLSCICLMYAINNVSVFANHNLFGIALLFALIWSGYSALLMGSIFGGTFYITNMSVNNGKIAIIILVICFILFVINRIRKINYRFGLPFILCSISFVPYIYFSLGDAKQNFTIILSCMFALFFLYVCIYFFKGTIKRGFCTRLNPDEKICGGIVLALFAYGLNNIPLLGVEWAIVLCSVVVLLATYTFGMVETIVISFIFGLGISLNTFNPIYISFMTCFGVFSAAFKSTTKVFSSLSVVIVYLFFSLYFTEHIIFKVPTLIGIIVVSISFVCVPNKLVRYMKDVFAGYKNKLAVRNVVKTSKDKIYRRLIEVSKVFNEMEFSFKRTLQKTLPLTDKTGLIKDEIVESVCKGCPNIHKCMRINGDYTTKVFDSLVEAGISKGKVSDVDLNNYIYSRCPKVPYLISVTNEIIKSYREYNILSNNMDCSKILMAEQFKGISILMQGIAKDVSEEVSFDIDLETRITEDLLYKNIFVEEVIVYDKSVMESDVVLLVKNDRMDKKIIEKVVTKACKARMNIISIEPSDIPNVSVVTMSSCPNYDIIFGSATCNKAGTIISGDTHSFVKIDNGKYMLALSDGMGSGTAARETSDLTISLIENYYKAGFDNSMILSSVNKLLSLNNEETFSAIDICILDFFNNSMDFIKLGTPNSFIKRKTGVELIQSSGLPIGILEEIRPHITKKYITNFDIVILVSDGIADAFARDNLQVFINNLNLINPQEIATAILERAKALNHNVCEDDMTVVTARIFPTK